MKACITSIRVCYILAALLLLSASAVFAAKKEFVERKPQPTPAQEQAAVVVYYSDQENNPDEERVRSGLGRLFEDQGLAAGIAAGSNLINHSIDMIMENLFYNLLDRDFSAKLSGYTYFNLGTRRDLYPTPAGSYVVVDRLTLGPEYSRPFAQIGKAPISLGANGKVSILDIYFRSDGERLAEQNELPAWRSVANNLFGLLPLLTAILPPSFNPNELYDPINLLETPFAFPLSVGGFKTMPVGTIRSFDISGGVDIPIDLSTILSKDILDAIEKTNLAKFSLVPSVFIEGDHRINVLRRSRNIAWVGLSQTRRFGARLNHELGKVLKIFEQVSPLWKGLPLKLFPIELGLSKSKAYFFNQVYEFDLREPKAKSAFLRAVRGDFKLSGHYAKLSQESKALTGVRFHLTKTEAANEYARKSDPNLIVFSHDRSTSEVRSEIELLDESGRTFALEARKDLSERQTEILTGRQQEKYNAKLEMKVLRVARGANKNEFTYIFPPNEPDPLRFSINLSIIDGYLDSQEYREYLEQVRYFTKLPLRTAPALPRRDTKRIDERHRSFALADPNEDPVRLHVTPYHLGRMSVLCSIDLSADLIDRILKKSDVEIWSALGEAYGISPASMDKRQTSLSMMGRLAYAISWPAHLVNVYSKDLEYEVEAQSILDAIRELAAAKTPMEKLLGFFELMKTNHPDKLGRALVTLLENINPPRYVSFFTKAKSKLPPDVKEAFSSLQDTVFRSVSVYPDPWPSRVADEKLRTFLPDGTEDRRIRPIINRVEVAMEPLKWEEVEEIKKDPNYKRFFTDAELNSPHVRVRVYARKVESSSDANVFIRFEEAGQLRLGKLVLAERVIKSKAMPVLDTQTALPTDQVYFEFFLTGPKSALRQGLYDVSTTKLEGEFQLNVSLSSDANSWSDDRDVRFSLVRSRLIPAD